MLKKKSSFSFFVSLNLFHQTFLIIPSDAYLQIRVTFVNEFGVEEAGIDGGGIFKDFMENITRAAFDVQYGLFKVKNLYLYVCTYIYIFIFYLVGL